MLYSLPLRRLWSWGFSLPEPSLHNPLFVMPLPCRLLHLSAIGAAASSSNASCYYFIIQNCHSSPWLFMPVSWSSGQIARGFIDDGAAPGRAVRLEPPHQACGNHLQARVRRGLSGAPEASSSLRNRLQPLEEDNPEPSVERCPSQARCDARPRGCAIRAEQAV